MLTALLLFWVLLGSNPADSNQAGTLLKRGLVALQHGQLTEARVALEEASRVEPKNPYVWASLAETYLRLKEPGKAAIAAQSAEQGVAADPLVAHALAMYYSEAGDAAHAARLEEQYRAAEWEKAKTDPRIAFQYAQTLLEREQFTKAADVIATALQAHPTDPQLILALGVARYGQRRFEDSVTAFLKVVQIDPSIQQPYLFLGKMLDQAGGHLGEIVKAYEAWLANNPKNATAGLLLAKALLVQDSRNARAETLLRQSIALEPNNWESHYELGVLLAGKRDYAAAAVELARSSELNPKEAMPHYHLARVYDRLGQTDRAAAERKIHQQLTQQPETPKTQ